MQPDAPAFGDLPIQKKLLLARGSGFEGAELRLDVLIALAQDDDEEVCQLAQQTLDRLEDADCAHLLASAPASESVVAYYLDPRHFRLSLLPALLKNAASSAQAIAGFAARADTAGISQLLAHLEELPSPVLAALKTNPAYLDWQQKAQASNAALYRQRAVDPMEEKIRIDGQKRLCEMIAAAQAEDTDSGKEAAAVLNSMSDEECLDLLTAVSLQETVARHYLSQPHIRPALLPLLLGHPDTPQDAIVSLAASAGPEIVPTLLDQLDLLRTPALIALKDNPTYLQWQKQPPTQGYVLEVDLLELLIQEMESDKPPSVGALEQAFADADISTKGAAEGAKGGLVNKIARMKVAQRVKLALLGTREERSLLIRDTSRVVFRAVLGSPKLTDSEVEGFSMLKNVNVEVLRLISMNRRFMKSYVILKNLANNPRTPVDVSLPLLNRLLPNDLRALSSSREIPETLRKMAQKLIRSRTS